MSTGPGPTHKADGSHNASIDDIAELLVQDESRKTVHDDEVLEDGLDLILETPGPVIASTFMPPPPAPPAGTTEEGDSAEAAGSPANLAYDDLLAKLVLPPKAPTPEPVMVEPMAPTPGPIAPEPLPTPVMSPISLPPEPSRRISSPNLLSAPPSDERTLVTDNPLVAEEQQAAVREGRTEGRVMLREAQPLREEMRPVQTDRIGHVGMTTGTKTKLAYLAIGGLLAMGGMLFGIIFMKLLAPTPAPQPTVIVAPPTHAEPPPPAPVAPAAAAPTPAQAEAVQATPPPAQAAEAAPTPEPEMAAPPKAPKASRPKAPRAVTATPVAAAKPAVAVPAAPAKPAAANPAAATPAAPAKPAKAGKAGKAGKPAGWADPFE